MIPRSIKIGAHQYQIKTALRKEMGTSCGDVDNERNIIRVIKHASRSRKIEIILHEALHAMVVGHPFEEQEDTAFVLLGEALAKFIADNPEFITEALSILTSQEKTE